MDYEKDLEKLRNDLNHARNIKNRSEIALESLQREEEEIINQIKSLGVSPDKINEEIEKLKSDIEKLLKEADDLMPHETLDKVKNK